MVIRVREDEEQGFRVLRTIPEATLQLAHWTPLSSLLLQQDGGANQDLWSGRAL